MSKVAFIWAKGTSYVFNWFPISIPTQQRGDLFAMPGLEGRAVTFQGGDVQNEPLLSMLDPNVFDIYNVDYPAALLPGEISLEQGVDAVIATIEKLPAGQPFILGGYSQGAAVHSLCYRQGLQAGTTGVLESYRPQFLGATMFGNPMRAIGHRGAVGGTWSGSWDVPGSTTGGGGCYPSTGQFARLSSAESKWVEFIGVIDTVTCNGTSQKGQWFSSFVGDTLALGKGGLLNLAATIIGSGLASAAAVKEQFDIAATETLLVDLAGKLFGGAAHGHYGWMPPPNSDGTYSVTEVEVGDETYYKANGDTMYQVAVKYALSLAAEYATAPILLPTEPTTTASAGWSTTLIPPAA